MKMLLIVLVMMVLPAPAAQAQDPTAAADAFMTALYKRLARTRNAVLIDAPSDDAARLGTLYMYQEPKCFIPASKVIRNGIPISIDPYFSEIDVSKSVRVLREPKRSGAYSVNPRFAAELVADMGKAGVLDASVSPSALVTMLSKAEMSFRVVRKEVDFLLLHRQVKEHDIDMGALPPEYEGILVPLAQFSITDFKYDSSKASELGLKLGLGASFLSQFLNKIAGSFSASRTRETGSTVEIDTSVNFAFKPNVLFYRHAKCSRW